jgi:hypothetical protein
MKKAGNTEEKWVLITELNGEATLHHYKFSNHGRITMVKRGKGPESVVVPKLIGGFPCLSIGTKNGTRSTIYLHRLVAECFLPPPSDKHTFVIHIDGNHQNNHVENLKWITESEMVARRVAARKAQVKGAKRKSAAAAPASPAVSKESAPAAVVAQDHAVFTDARIARHFSIFAALT